MDHDGKDPRKKKHAAGISRGRGIGGILY